MSPEQIRHQVQSAYRKAMENRNVQHQRSSGFDHLFRGLKLYGREAGVDLIETHLDAIVHEATEAAGCKAPSTTITLGGFGQAALAGATQALQRLTGLKVDARGSMITLTWA